MTEITHNILAHIFCYFDFPELGTLPLVCKKWKEVFLMN